MAGLLSRILVFALFVPLVSLAAEPPDVLATLRPGHPRLLATAAEFDRLAKDASDPLRAEAVRRVIATAGKTLEEPLTVYKLHPDLLVEARSAFQKVVVTAAAYRLTKDPRFAERSRQEMVNLAGFPDWNPAHFLDVGEIAMGVAIGYDWLYDVLPPADRATIKAALMEKALVFAPTIYGKIAAGSTDFQDKRLWWVTTSNNWNQVCHGGLLAAALALADEEPATARLVVPGVAAYLPLSMRSYEPDGGWPEGPGYWAYGTSFNVLILGMLESALGSDLGLAKAEPAFAKTAEFRLQFDAPEGLVYNYADVATGWATRVAPAFGQLAGRYGPPAAVAYYREQLARQFARLQPDKEDDRFFPFNVLWMPPAPKEAPSAPLDAHYRGDADVAVFRSAWGDREALYLGFKAGKNGVSHGHLDLGSFVVDADGERWSVELGPDDYNLPGYFGAKRWDYYRLVNAGHSTLTPGDRLQDAKATAPIAVFESAPQKAFAVADLTAAYPGAAAKIVRGAFLLDRARVLVQDDVTALAPGTPLYWRMLTGAKIEIAADGRTATLTSKGKTLRAEILSPAGVAFTTAPADPPTPAEKKNDGITVLLATVPAGTAPADVRLAVLLTPVGPKWPASLPAPKIEALPAK